MNDQCAPEPDNIRNLFSNADPEFAWDEAEEIVTLLYPEFDLALLRTTFDDVLRLFGGDYPGYAAIATPYHDLSHTLSVFVCATRMMHGLHASGVQVTGQEMMAVMLAALLHDVGYAQLRGSETGTGAQFTRTHVSRGIEFMRHYARSHGFPRELSDQLGFLMQSTDHIKGFSSINFPDERTRMLGQIISSADLAGQMADRMYLEKLMYLYFEFKEAAIGNYQDIMDLFGRSSGFYQHVQLKLDNELGGMVHKLPHYFQARLGVGRNFYLEAMEGNIAYLGRVVAEGENGFALLKRGGVLQKVKQLMPEME
ncbi:MAG TPA: HD domain-containing protein [Gallionellaceae bacterium]|nr:HD domain-containing protein [Gallionellaceae bacterium]